MRDGSESEPVRELMLAYGAHNYDLYQKARSKFVMYYVDVKSL